MADQKMRHSGYTNLTTEEPTAGLKTLKGYSYIKEKIEDPICCFDRHQQ